MNKSSLMLGMVLLFLSGNCFAQTGILNQDAEFRKLPPEARN